MHLESLFHRGPIRPGCPIRLGYLVDHREQHFDVQPHPPPLATQTQGLAPELAAEAGMEGRGQDNDPRLPTFSRSLAIDLALVYW